MKKYELGNKSEAIVLNAYLSAGFIVSIPFGTGTSYDLIVDSGFGLYKIQVKTAWSVKGIIKYKFFADNQKVKLIDLMPTEKLIT